MTFVQLSNKWPTLAALIEAGTGLALVMAPSIASRLLFHMEQVGDAGRDKTGNLMRLVFSRAGLRRRQEDCSNATACPVDLEVADRRVPPACGHSRRLLQMSLVVCARCAGCLVGPVHPGVIGNTRNRGRRIRNVARSQSKRMATGNQRNSALKTNRWFT